jgi:hypothetical protein
MHRWVLKQFRKIFGNKTNKVLPPTTGYLKNPSYPPLSSNKECETKSYKYKTKSSMYARTTKSMLELSEDGSKEFIIAIAIA